jgi:hypothetical protein
MVNIFTAPNLIGMPLKLVGLKHQNITFELSSGGIESSHTVPVVEQEIVKKIIKPYT